MIRNSRSRLTGSNCSMISAMSTELISLSMLLSAVNSFLSRRELTIFSRVSNSIKKCLLRRGGRGHEQSPEERPVWRLRCCVRFRRGHLVGHATSGTLSVGTAHKNSPHFLLNYKFSLTPNGAIVKKKLSQTPGTSQNTAPARRRQPVLPIRETSCGAPAETRRRQHFPNTVRFT